MRSLAQELAVEELRQRERDAAPPAAPAPVVTVFNKPRPLAYYLVDGEVPEGFEGSGRLFPSRVMAEPAQYLVTGETSYSDGRRYLDFGMNPDWIEANTEFSFRGAKYPDWYCPDCDGKNGDHRKVSIPDKDGGKPMTVKCPRDTRRSFGR